MPLEGGWGGGGNGSSLNKWGLRALPENFFSQKLEILLSKKGMAETAEGLQSLSKFGPIWGLT
jgi:hypothetical protein